MRKKPLSVSVNSPHSGPSRWCSVWPAGIPRISPGPCSAAGGVTHHLLPEDTGDEPRNGTPRPEPTWGRSGSQAVPARLHSCCWCRWTGPVWGRGCESIRLNSATSRRQTHVAKTHTQKTHRSPVGWWPPVPRSEALLSHFQQCTLSLTIYQETSA